MQASSPIQVRQEIQSLFARFGNEAYGESLSQLEHMVQSAQLAEQEGFDTETILAAFLHDIGHLYGHAIEAQQMDGKGTQLHERLGADYLRQKGFSEKIAQLVEGHVAAKRYLCFKDEQYLAELSPASRHTLREQGGPMSDAEATAFEQHPLFSLSLQMRHWDEAAKLENQPLPPLQKYWDLIEHHLTHTHA